MFTKNIIFLDTEFSDLNPYNGELISVGLIKFSGESLYIEIECPGKIHPWVKKNILPKMIGKKLSRSKAKQKISRFIGGSKPHAVAFVPQYDMIYLNKLFGVEKNPLHWMPIDFASVLAASKINPQKYLDLKNKFFRDLEIDTKNFVQHNALDDARLLRETFFKFFKIKDPARKKV